jgi:hypothetical protein
LQDKHGADFGASRSSNLTTPFWPVQGVVCCIFQSHFP